MILCFFRGANRCPREVDALYRALHGKKVEELDDACFDIRRQEGGFTVVTADNSVVSVTRYQNEPTLEGQKEYYTWLKEGPKVVVLPKGVYTISVRPRSEWGNVTSNRTDVHEDYWDHLYNYNFEVVEKEERKAVKKLASKGGRHLVYVFRRTQNGVLSFDHAARNLRELIYKWNKEPAKFWWKLVCGKLILT